LHVSVAHYENFPVASFLLPRRLRPAVLAIYRFARTADDLADEGDASPVDRLGALDAFDRALDAIVAGQPASTPLFAELAAAIDRHSLSTQPFRDLLSAFRQDVNSTRYAVYADLLDYCRGQPIRLAGYVLQLHGVAAGVHLAWSDAICTALQLINFWQDVALDWRKNRIYLPREDLVRFGVDEAQIGEGRCDDAWRSLMAFETARARMLLESGRPPRSCIGLGGKGWSFAACSPAVTRIPRRHRCHAGRRLSPSAAARPRRLGDHRVARRVSAAPSSACTQHYMTPDEYCRQKAAQSGSSFYYSFLFLPPDRRRAITALYAFCREVDDVVDDVIDPDVARTKLAWWRQEIAAAFAGNAQHPVAQALQPVIAQFELSQEQLQTVIDGMAMDLERNRYLDFTDLERYCHRVAGVVGQMSAQIFGSTDPATPGYAHDLGIAFQLTNIIRDVGEDARRGRSTCRRKSSRASTSRHRRC
jgi:squalene synthase HpnC